MGLLGGECTGKTSLAADLETLVPACVVDEQLRRFAEERRRPPGRSEQRAVMLAQMAAEDAAAAACRHQWLIADPAPLMTAVYSLVYFDDDSLVDEAVTHALSYDCMLWCDVDLPWQADPGQRDGPEFRLRAHEILETLIGAHLVPAGARVHRLTGDREQRVAQARRAWQPLGSDPPT